MSNIAIGIDCWQGLFQKRNIIKYCNINIDAIFFATYNGGEDMSVRHKKYTLNDKLKTNINIYNEELIPNIYKSTDYVMNGKLLGNEISNKRLQLISQSYEFDNIFMMGGAWNNCLHYRSYGIYNVRNNFPEKNIMIYSDTIGLDGDIHGNWQSKDCYNELKNDCKWTEIDNKLFIYND